MKIKVNVTREDIDAGTPKCWKNCAIAQALRRTGHDVEAVTLEYKPVLRDGAYVWHMVGAVVLDGVERALPEEAVQLIRVFDATYDATYDKSRVQPVQFEIDEGEVPQVSPKKNLPLGPHYCGAWHDHSPAAEAAREELERAHAEAITNMIYAHQAKLDERAWGMRAEALREKVMREACESPIMPDDTVVTEDRKEVAI